MRYAVDLGWTIVPCGAGTIRGHWQEHPNDLIGLVPGKCDLVGVDVDGPKGIASWEAIETHNPGMGETVRGSTPHGRRYIYSANGRDRQGSSTPDHMMPGGPTAPPC